MTALFKSEKTFTGQIAELARPLTVDDVDIISVSSTEEPENLEHVCSVRAGTHIKLKQSCINKLLEALAIEVNDNGRYANSKNNVRGLTDTWDSTKPNYYPAYLTTSLSFRGLRSDDAKMNRYKEKLAETKASYDECAEQLISTVIENIQKDIEDTIEMSNEVTKNELRSAVVELKVNNPEGFLNDEETTENEAYKKEQKEIQAQMAALKEKMRLLDEKQYQLKRASITRAALNALDTKGKAIVDSFRDENRDNPTEFTLFI